MSGEQIYFTHCASGDGTADEGGYGVRAASSADAAAQRFSLSLPPHELPVDAWNLGLLPHQAPRRLALWPLPDGRSALVHSAYLREDSRGRPRSYFTHLLVYPRLDLLAAARAWGSPDWRTSYPPGAPQSLPPLAGPPAPGPLDDNTLAEFLSASGRQSADQTLGGVIFPVRWDGDLPARQTLLRQALAGTLRVLSEGSGRRLFVLAEPGVVALLVYAVARLLPPGLTGELTFSTYESPDGAVWDRTAARIVGTWNAGEQPLDAEQLRRHGYGIDAFRLTPALEVPPIADVLLALAAQRDAELAELHALWARDEHLSAENLGDVIRVRPAYQRVLGGRTTRDDLLTLAGCSLGRPLVREQEAALWPLVRSLSPTDEAVRSAYEPTLRARRAELEADLRGALGAGEPADWLSRWVVVRSLLPAEGRAALFSSLLEGGANLPSVWRVALLREWHSLSPAPGRLAGLLAPADEHELNDLRGTGLPAAWLAQALWLALPSLAPAVLRALQSGGKELLASFCSVVPAEVEDRLAVLLPRDDPASARRFASFLGAGLTLDAVTLERLLARCGADAPHWCAEVWRRGALAAVSRALPADSPMLTKVWANCCAAIDRRLLGGDEGQRETLQFLFGCQKKAQGAIPPAAAEVLADWAALHQQLHQPADPAQAPAGLEQACRRRGVGSRADLLAEAFGPAFASEAVPAEQLRRAIRSALGFFHPDEDAAFAVLLALADRAPDARRAAYHLAFLEGTSEASRAALMARYGPRLRLDRETASRLLQPARWGWVAAVAGAAFAAGVVVGLVLGWLLFSR